MKLYLKTVVMFVIYLAPFILLLTVPMNEWFMLNLVIIIGVGMACVGMNVMHDGNHGSYSSKPLVNKIMGNTIYILSGNTNNWKIQHNILHHTFTNVDGFDEDIDGKGLMRLSENAEWKSYHRFQHIYSIFFYGFLTLNWALIVDFLQIIRYNKRNLFHVKKISLSWQWLSLIISKIVYYFIWIALPIMFIDIAIWKIILGFLIMHYIAGLILAVVFQLAHVVEDTKMIKVDDSGYLQNNWTVHQLITTANFATKDKFACWMLGGLNFQVEHHLFPHISHIHYPNISKIVKKTTQEFNIPYNEYKTFWVAVKSHFRKLKRLAKKP